MNKPKFHIGQRVRHKVYREIYTISSRYQYYGRWRYRFKDGNWTTYGEDILEPVKKGGGNNDST